MSFERRFRALGGAPLAASPAFKERLLGAASCLSALRAGAAEPTFDVPCPFRACDQLQGRKGARQAACLLSALARQNRTFDGG